MLGSEDYYAHSMLPDYAAYRNHNMDRLET